MMVKSPTEPEGPTIRHEEVQDEEGNWDVGKDMKTVLLRRVRERDQFTSMSSGGPVAGSEDEIDSAQWRDCIRDPAHPAPETVALVSMYERIPSEDAASPPAAEAAAASPPSSSPTALASHGQALLQRALSAESDAEHGQDDEGKVQGISDVAYRKTLPYRPEPDAAGALARAFDTLSALAAGCEYTSDSLTAVHVRVAKLAQAQEAAAAEESSDYLEEEDLGPTIFKNCFKDSDDDY
eukprot:g1573.t1